MALPLSLLLAGVVTGWWLWFFVRRDRHPEPAWLLARTFAWGMFAWLVAAAFEASLGRLLNSDLPLALLLVALLTATIEEVSKFVAASTATTEPSFDEPMDGLVYAVTAALGFALVENLTYVLGFGSHAGNWHALVATLAHALFSAPQGYALGGKFWTGERGWRVRGLTMSVLLHFVFNSLLTSHPSLWQLAALALVVLLMMLLAGRFYLQFEETARQLGTRPQRVPDSPRR
ncbi:PrsW family intramembrane metalloprotease [Deinococcus cavernae]|uniref:PrsW family intramembrane metalloprotease n=1 Tax=Deinococcus cavernae TaxID=2320857 RepID=UPI0018F43B02|nr:PrsW family glutamic-type intramembrane protease [Deinococcus cavernae]